MRSGIGRNPVAGRHILEEMAPTPLENTACKRPSPRSSRAFGMGRLAAAVRGKSSNFFMGEGSAVSICASTNTRIFALSLFEPPGQVVLAENLDLAAAGEDWGK